MKTLLPIILLLLAGTLASAAEYRAAHLAAGDWQTRIEVYNPLTVAASFTLTTFRDDGSPVENGLVFTAPGQQWVEIPHSVLNHGGMARLVAPGAGPLLVKLSYRYRTSPSICEFFLTADQQSREWVIPNPQNGLMDWFGMAVPNFSSEPVDVELTAYSQGRQLAVFRSQIQPCTRLVHLHTDLWPELQVHQLDTVVVRASAPVAAPLSISGTNGQDRHLQFAASPFEPGPCQRELHELVASHAEAWHQPALGGLLVTPAGIQALDATGLLVVDDPAMVQLNSCFHIGSNFKSMTALLVACLVEEGHLRWNMTLAEALPGLAMQPAYQNITLVQLLSHQAGLPPFYSAEEEPYMLAADQLVRNSSNDPHEQKVVFAGLVLLMDPAAAPGQEFLYSNAGYVIAGLVAELATGRSFEALMQEYVIDPLGMTSSGYGWPAEVAGPAEPRGHYGPFPDGSLITQALPDEYAMPAYSNPAGNMFCSLEDQGRYLQDQLLGLLGQGKLLPVEGYRFLHHPHYLAPDRSEGYGLGWGVLEADGHFFSWHAGSGGTFYSYFLLDQTGDFALGTASNCGNGEAAAGGVALGLLECRSAAAAQQIARRVPRSK